MISFPVPGSWGSPLREFNQCHEPSGTPTGGRFCARDGSKVHFETRPMDSGGGYGHNYERVSVKDSKTGEELGFAAVYYEDGLANIEYLGIAKKHRPRGGLGSALIKATALRALNRGYRLLGGEVTSKGIIRVMTKVLGKPDMITNGIRDLTPEEGEKGLPDGSPENAEGVIEDANHTFYRWKLSRSGRGLRRAK